MQRKQAENDQPPRRGEVLVAILNNVRDFAAAKDKGWYRIPVHLADKRLKNRWPPRWLAFYQTKVFGREAWAVNYYAEVLGVRRATRRTLLPDEPEHPNAAQRYYKLVLAPLQRLPRPILSRRWRRIVFIQTTWDKLTAAVEINDLYDESPLEDKLWAEFKRLQIAAERQEFVEVKKRHYALDFAVYCATGKLDVEADGDTWHADPARIPLDNRRDNDLETDGWHILRFNGPQVNEEMADYCLPAVTRTINKLGGVDEEERAIPRRIHLEIPDQRDFFDE
jgi:very-short-patch-repair endonuclease